MTSGIPSSSPGSRRGRRAGLTALVAGSLIASGIVVATTVAGPAAATNTYPFTDILTIETSAGKTAAKSYNSVNTVAPTVQELNAKNCALTIGGAQASGSVVGLTATRGAGETPPEANVGVYGGSIGVAEKGSGNGQSCSQVNSGSSPEALTLTLTGKTASLAVLDIEVQKNVVIDAVAMRGETVVETFTLATGTAAVPVGATECKVGQTSSAPNSNSSDNCKWEIAPGSSFDTLVLTTAADSPGQFSLEGGSDWAGGALAKDGDVPANATYFLLDVSCEPLETGVNKITIGSATGEATANSTWQRLPYNADGSPCLKSNVEEVSQDGNEVYFKKGKNQPFAQYLFEIEWNVPAGAKEKATTIDFELNVNGDGQVPMTWCPESLWGTAEDGTTPKLVGLQYASTAEFNAKAEVDGIFDYDFAPSTAEENGTDAAIPQNGITQYACTFGKKETSYSPANGYTFIEQIYVVGDAYARR